MIAEKNTKLSYSFTKLEVYEALVNHAIALGYQSPYGLDFHIEDCEFFKDNSDVYVLRFKQLVEEVLAENDGESNDLEE